MSTASTNQPATPPELPLAAVPVAEAIPPAVQRELTALRSELATTSSRLTWLESSLLWSPMSRALVPLDSPEVQRARELATEMFPGCKTELEVECDPAEPEWPWYSVAIRWLGQRAEVRERRMRWHKQLAAEFPHLRDQFRLSISCHEAS